MAVHDFRSQRLFIDGPLHENAVLNTEREQANYLLNVLRLGDGDRILVFNGVNGEWEADIQAIGRKKCNLLIRNQTRPQPVPCSLEYCFAPLKQARQDYMVQKAVEMGVGALQPVITQYTQVRSVNLKRLRANAIEAAEQCGVLSIPRISDPVPLGEMLKNLSPGNLLVFCDEHAPTIEELADKKANQHETVSLLIGPEGGFSPEERERIIALENTVRLGLGPRILRADTAAVAALALIQAKLGDWYNK